ncbi:MAG: hypothetical protein CK424_03310 [Legionella sp.]|nr:MAG: hypothetical protein CK424_03310 [Legionella sp.]
MTKKTGQHIVKNPAGGWAVKKGGASKATKIYNTKDEAVEHGKQIAKNQKTELYIHGKDGKIQDKNSYGKDPCPPKDKK